MEWIPMIFPVLAVIVCFAFFKSKTLWWEPIIPLAVVAIFILIFKFAAEHSLTSDTEYWSGYIVKAEYFEDWNERVSCRHPRYCTRTVTRGSGKNRYTTTEQYQCGWQHAYDVDYHPEYWKKTDNNGISSRISKSDFLKYVKLFGNNKFVDLHRDYHTDDGDKYQTDWNGSDQTIDILVTKHTYTNKVQTSHSVFNFPEVDTSDIRQFKLFDYPPIKDNGHQDHLLGMNDKPVERKLEILNAKLGKKKQVKAFIAIYDGPIKAAELQEAYWKGGNKNEFIVCLGLDKNGSKPKWVHIISWNLNKTVNIKVRNWVMKQDKLNLAELSDVMYTELDAGFERQPFAEFSYLKVELTNGQILAIWIVSFILSVGIGIWIVMNPLDEDNPTGNRYRKYRHW